MEEENTPMVTSPEIADDAIYSVSCTNLASTPAKMEGVNEITERVSNVSVSDTDDRQTKPQTTGNTDSEVSTISSPLEQRTKKLTRRKKKDGSNAHVFVSAPTSPSGSTSSITRNERCIDSDFTRINKVSTKQVSDNSDSNQSVFIARENIDKMVSKQAPNILEGLDSDGGDISPPSEIEELSEIDTRGPKRKRVTSKGGTDKYEEVDTSKDKTKGGAIIVGPTTSDLLIAATSDYNPPEPVNSKEDKPRGEQ